MDGSSRDGNGNWLFFGTGIVVIILRIFTIIMWFDRCDENRYMLRRVRGAKTEVGRAKGDADGI